MPGEPLPKIMWAIKGDGIGIIAGTVAYTRQAAYDFVRRAGQSNQELRNNGYRAIKVRIKYAG